MHGDEAEPHSGIIPKLFSNLFQQIKQQQDRTFSVFLSFLQIYNERIYDLLNPSGLNGAGLKLRWNKD